MRTVSMNEGYIRTLIGANILFFSIANRLYK